MSGPELRLDSPEGVLPARPETPPRGRSLGTVRSLFILTRMSVRRRFNRVRATMARGRSKPAGGKNLGREATPRKARGGGWLTFVFAVVFLLNSGFIAHRFLEGLANETKGDESTEPDPRRHALELLEAESRSILAQGLNLAREIDRIVVEREQLRARIAQDPNAPGSERRRHDLWRLDQSHREALAERDHLGRQFASIERKIQALRESGPRRDGTRAASGLSLPRIDRSGDDAGLILIVAVMLVLLGIGVVLSSLGNRNPDLGQVGWGLEWLFTFPVSTRALFAAKLAEYTLTNFLGWFVFSPLLFLYFARAGFGIASLFVAVAGTLYLNLIIGAIQLVGETWLRKRLDRPQLKNRQALFTVLGILILLSVFALAMTPGGVPTLKSLVVAETRPLLLAAPGSSLALVAFGGASGWLASGVVLAHVLILSFGAVSISERLVRTGLVNEGGPYVGTRVAVGPAGIVRRGWFRGVVAKDLRLLWRDRNLFVQTLVVPLVIVGFQIAVNAELLEAIRTSFNHAAVMAFGLGAYALLFSTVNALVVEGQAIWLLFTVPEPIERTVLRKALLWGTFASLGPTALLGWALTRPGALSAQNLLTAGLVIAGIQIYAIIGAVIGSLATDLFEKEARRRIRPAMLYLFMFLAGLYGYAIYAPVTWHRLAMLVLSASLAYAVWQKLRDQAAYLLDPTQSAPRRLSLSDGLVVVLVFFVLQGIIAVIFKNGTDLPLGPALVIAYAVAGALVVGGSLVIFEIRGTRGDLFTREKTRRVTLRSVLEGLGIGLFALGIGLTYTIAVDLVEPLRRLKDVLPHLTQVAAGSRWWFLVLVVGLAPPVEEFIFRGLIYRGLRRTARPAVAALASAVIFAICHPPIAFVPVFLLGVLTAVSLERHGRLIVPILIHAVYNGGALLLGG